MTCLLCKMQFQATLAPTSVRPVAEHHCIFGDHDLAVTEGIFRLIYLVGHKDLCLGDANRRQRRQGAVDIDVRYGCHIHPSDLVRHVR